LHVVDHHSGRLVWAAFGRDRKTVEKFLDLLGEERCKQIRLVSCDDADWITRPISERCPQAVICLDPWHIVKAATDALDDVRRQVWNEARRSGNKQLAKQLKGARFALWKRPENLTDRQQVVPIRIGTQSPDPYRGLWRDPHGSLDHMEVWPTGCRR
jgi:transposase